MFVVNVDVLYGRILDKIDMQPKCNSDYYHTGELMCLEKVKDNTDHHYYYTWTLTMFKICKGHLIEKVTKVKFRCKHIIPSLAVSYHCT